MARQIATYEDSEMVENVLYEGYLIKGQDNQVVKKSVRDNQIDNLLKRISVLETGIDPSYGNIRNALSVKYGDKLKEYKRIYTFRISVPYVTSVTETTLNLTEISDAMQPVLRSVYSLDSAGAIVQSLDAYSSYDSNTKTFKVNHGSNNAFDISRPIYIMVDIIY